MLFPVLIHPMASHGFQAKLFDPQSLVAEGATREEALERLKGLLQKELSQGGELTYLAVGDNSPHPALALAGSHENDLYYEEYQKAMEEYRQQVEDDPDR